MSRVGNAARTTEENPRPRREGKEEEDRVRTKGNPTKGKCERSRTKERRAKE